jgi:hypothetical protein
MDSALVLNDVYRRVVYYGFHCVPLKIQKICWSPVRFDSTNRNNAWDAYIDTLRLHCRYFHMIIKILLIDYHQII